MKALSSQTPLDRPQSCFCSEPPDLRSGISASFYGSLSQSRGLPRYSKCLDWSGNVSAQCIIPTIARANLRDCYSTLLFARSGTA